jgi:hypothetical protein
MKPHVHGDLSMFEPDGVIPIEDRHRSGRDAG